MYREFHVQGCLSVDMSTSIGVGRRCLQVGLPCQATYMSPVCVQQPGLLTGGLAQVMIAVACGWHGTGVDPAQDPDKPQAGTGRAMQVCAVGSLVGGGSTGLVGCIWHVRCTSHDASVAWRVDG